MVKNVSKVKSVGKQKSQGNLAPGCSQVLNFSEHLASGEGSHHPWEHSFDTYGSSALVSVKL